jgi:hypothetical protein
VLLGGLANLVAERYGGQALVADRVVQVAQEDVEALGAGADGAPQALVGGRLVVDSLGELLEERDLLGARSAGDQALDGHRVRRGGSGQQAYDQEVQRRQERDT